MSESSSSAAEILAARAQRLARRTTAGDNQALTVEMLGFTVGRERFAVESRFVFSVVQLANLVPLPGAQTPVVGLTPWRGDVLTVLDLRRVVGGAPRALDDLGKVIVLGETGPEFGVLADTLDGLLPVDPTALHPLSATRNVEIPGLLRGVTADAVHVLDAKTLIAHQVVRTAAPSPAVPPSTPVMP
jgi:purine-binding chemotaxis protein CheW